MLYMDFVGLKPLLQKELKTLEQLDILAAAQKETRVEIPHGPVPLAVFVRLLVKHAHLRGVKDASIAHTMGSKANFEFWQCARCVRANSTNVIYCAQCGARRI